MALTDNVCKETLPNGLTLLVKENHASPVVSLVAFVKAGYFHEPDHWGGISHVIEHMFFKGTAKRPGKELVAQAVREIGGYINAGTYYEETSYHITLPSVNLEKGIEIQSDTFLHSLFDAGELERELEVIIQESKQKRDNPQAMLIESLYALAFDSHRIRRWRIGEDETLRSFRRDDLLQFIQNMYRPENIILSVAGDVETGNVVRLIDRYWGEMPRGFLRKDLSPMEPERRGFRYQRMEADIRQKLFVIGYHAPHMLHEDTPALVMAGNILSDGRSSRLYRKLREEKRLVSSIEAEYEGFSELGIFTLNGDSLEPDPLEAERAVFDELQRLIDSDIQPEELKRVKTRLQSSNLFEMEETLGMAKKLANAEAYGDYHLVDTHFERLQAMTNDRIREAVWKYLNPENATLVEYLPRNGGLPPRRGVFEEVAPQAWEYGAAIKESDNGETVEYAHPSRLGDTNLMQSQASFVILPRRDLPLVAIQILFRGGKREEKVGNSGITQMMLNCSRKSAAGLSGTEIAGIIEGLGASLGVTPGMDHFGYCMKIPMERASEGLEILAKIIREPDFPEDEVKKEKEAHLEAINHHYDSMFPHAMDLFQQACYGEQPYGLPSVGREEAIRAITSDSLKEWWSRWFHRANAVVSVVGDGDTEALRRFALSILPVSEGVSPSLSNNFYGENNEKVFQVERHQTAAVLGFPGVSVTDEDRYALDLLAEIGSGLAGRFFQAVRGEHGLAYAVQAAHRSKRDCGNFIIYTATSPENELMAREIILRECERFKEEPVTDKELRDAKESINGKWIIGMQTFTAQCMFYGQTLAYGLPEDHMKRYLQRIREVTADDILEVARKYINTDRIWLGIVRGGVSR